MVNGLLRLMIGLLLKLSALWMWLDWTTFRVIDWASEALIRRRWHRTRKATRRR